MQLPAINLLTLDKIKGLLQFSGNCNVNLATKKNLMAFLKDAGYSESLVNAILSRRKAQPFEKIADIYGLLGYTKAKGQACPDDYFTTTSTMIRYQIWVQSEKSQDCYYLDTVWQRQKAGVKKEWQVTPLASRELWNKAVPEIPKLEEPTEDHEQNKETSPSPNP